MSLNTSEYVSALDRSGPTGEVTKPGLLEATMDWFYRALGIPHEINSNEVASNFDEWPSGPPSGTMCSG